MLLTMFYKRAIIYISALGYIKCFDQGGTKEKEKQLQKTDVLTRES